MLVVDRTKYNTRDALIEYFGGNPEDLGNIKSPGYQEDFARTLANAILHPDLEGLTPPADVISLGGDLNLSLDHSVHGVDVSRVVNVRRALLLGANDRSTKIKPTLLQESGPICFTDNGFFRSTPLDHLSVLLGGSQTFYQQNACPTWMISTPPKGDTAWATSRHKQRSAVSLDYMVNQLDPADAGFHRKCYWYLEQMQHHASPRDLLLVVIEGPLMENQAWDRTDVHMDRKGLMDALDRIPGWKFVVDFSHEGYRTIEEKQNLFRAQLSIDGASTAEKIGVMASCRSPTNYEAMKAGYGDPSIHNQGMWDDFVNSLLFLRPISSYRLGKNITQNVAYPLIPEISTHFSVTL